ncbi:MAG: phenylalanine--tRNA ligase subunit beta [Alphaproteobacteria bacterium]|nr:phenylalanine--tRNA ligase subunit beta [Alphaproteobacteria bacterium]
MKVSLSWLKAYLKTEAGAAEIAGRLTSIGLEVEEIIDNASKLTPFIIGEIVAKDRHPNADRLNVLSVSTGTEKLQIVCGAPNCYVGMKSVLARPGDVIPLYNEKLEKGVIRGVESMGMLCSEKELGLSEDHEGIIDLKTDLPAGTPAAQAFGADAVIDINVTPNRPDCLGVKGIARDLAATGIGVFVNVPAEEIAGSFKSPVSVKIEDKACAQFLGRYIRGVKNGPSPKWMQERLIAAGLRPISALVDVTNYLTLCDCRPLHVFDADRIAGGLVVRAAADGEKLLALDDKEYTLATGQLVIADDSGVQSIAGVMGGIPTACRAETTNVFLESAYFDPISVAATGRDLNIVSDARARFERGVDPASCARGLLDATRLILDICGGEASEVVSAGAEPEGRRDIAFDFDLVSRRCGMDIPKAEQAAVLKKLGFSVKKNIVSVPSWRMHDVAQPVDLVEEIVRIYGTEHIPALTMRPESLPTGILLPHQKREVAVRRCLADRGLNQAITYSFTDSRLARRFGSKGIRVANPIASDLDEMRPSLIPGLLAAVKRNQDRGIKDVRLFEVGPEFLSHAPGDQRLVACGVRAGDCMPRHWLAQARAVDAYDAKADAAAALAAVEAPQAQVYADAPAWYHPGRAGSMKLGKNALAYFGELHPLVLKDFDIKTPVVAFEVYLDNVPASKPKSKLQKALKLSPFLPVTRDFAFVVDKDVPAEKLLSCIRSVNKDLIADVSVFDVYAGDKLPADKKQLAVQVVIQPADKTMTDDEINALATQIINLAAKNTGAALRSA